MFFLKYKLINKNLKMLIFFHKYIFLYKILLILQLKYLKKNQKKDVLAVNKSSVSN